MEALMRKGEQGSLTTSFGGWFRVSISLAQSQAKRLRNPLRLLLQVLETPSYRLCLLTCHLREEWTPALHIILALRLQLQTFQVNKGWTLCSNSHLCTFSWAQPKKEKFTFLAPIYQCSTGFCSHTIASSFWGWLQIMSILYSQKNSACINTSFFCLQILKNEPVQLAEGK